MGNWFERLAPEAVAIVAFVIIGAGAGMAVVFARNRAHSVLRDVVLLLALGLPLIGIELLLTLLPDADPWRARAHQAVLLAVAALATYGLSRLLLTTIRGWAERSDAVRPVQGTLEMIARVISTVIGALILLDMLKVSITPFLTTLGIGSLAVALALQDTLANFFAGLHLAADRPMRAGDYIKLDSGEEGFVVTVGWRSTRLRSPANNIVIIPNAKLAKETIVNFDLPDRRIAATARVPVAYGQDPRKVEKLLIEVLSSSAGKIPGLLSEPAPSVAFSPGFGDFALEFTVTCHVESFQRQADVLNEVRHRISERLRAEKIDLVRGGKVS